MTLGETIRQLRESKGWSQEELAGRSAVSFIAVYSCERERSSPSLSVLRRLCRALGVSLGLLDDVTFKDDKRRRREPRQRRRA
jgi:transcriptional regulator with XRE-family HTH domain